MKISFAWKMVLNAFWDALELSGVIGRAWGDRCLWLDAGSAVR